MNFCPRQPARFLIIPKIPLDTESHFWHYLAMKKQRAYTVKLSKEDYERLSQEAENRGVFMRKVLEDAITAYFALRTAQSKVA